MAAITLLKVTLTWVTQHGWTWDRCTCMQNFRLVYLQGMKCAMFQVLFGKDIFAPCDLVNEFKVKMMVLDKSSL